MRLIFLLCFVSLNLLSSAQQIAFRNYSSEAGLSNNRVRAIVQDSKGFIWVATANGLNRFDGHDFKIYHHREGDDSSLIDDRVTTLYQDQYQNLWVGTKGGLQLFDAATEEFYPGLNSSTDIFRKIGHVLVIYQASDNALWVGSTEGLFQLTVKERFFGVSNVQEAWESGALTIRQFTDDSEANSRIKHKRVWSLTEGLDQQLWIGTNAGLSRYDLKSARTKPVLLEDLPTTIAKASIHALETDRHGNIWVGTEEGLYRLLVNGEVEVFEVDPTREDALHESFITEINEDSEGFIWVGSDGGGLSRWSPTTTSFTHFKHHRPNSSSLSENNVEALYLDSNGGIWAGTHKGFSHYSPHRKAFRPYRPGEQEMAISEGSVESLTSSASGKLWIGIDDGGVNLFDPDSETFTVFQYEPGGKSNLPNNDIVGAIEDQEGNLWVASWGGGIGIYDCNASLNDLGIRNRYFLLDKSAEPPLREAFAWATKACEFGDIWILTSNNGLIQYRTADQEFQFYNTTAEASIQTKSNWVTSMCRKQEHIVWLSFPDGLYEMNLIAKSITHHTIEAIQNGKHITAILPADEHNLWLGTENGLVLYNPTDKLEKQWTSGQGLVNNQVKSIVMDQQGNLWLGTAGGLSRFSPDSEHFTNYDSGDGLPNSEFGRGATIAENGEIYMGTIDGLLRFHPDSIRSYLRKPNIQITDIRLFNESINVKDRTVATESGNSSYPKRIAFEYDEDNLSFEFAALEFLNPEKNQYQYRLLGLQESWTNTSANRRFVQYPNLPPGRYQFQVKASNHDGVWNEEATTLDIIIHHPWWQSWWAYLGYLLSFIVVSWIIFKQLNKRVFLQNRLKAEQAEATRLKELDTFKSRLFTSLTHEFRTPLTVILGMVEQIREKPNQFVADGTRLIESNGHQLLRLINQLLDLAKLENKAFKLELQNSEIIHVLRYLTESYQSYTNSKNVSLQFHSSVDQLNMDFDPVQLQHVLANLLSNAIKFTPSEGNIRVLVDREADNLRLQIIDTGIGIAETDLTQIFDRFFQVDNAMKRQHAGTGIGLAHCKELVTLMGGEIRVSSQPEIGTNFIVILPIRNNLTPSDTQAQEQLLSQLDTRSTLAEPRLVKNSTDTETAPLTKPDFPQLLIIEDNPDVTFYLKSCLQQEFNISIAYNGRIGIEKAIAQIPDLIISDVMMPEKGGLEVCNTLKEDLRTSHVPIILLTAKADLDSRIDGFSKGADAYLAKPFNKKELLIRIRSLIRRQQQLRTYFHNYFVKQNNKLSPLAPTLETTVEEAFIRKVNTIIEAHYADENFALPNLCQEIGMSRSQIFRKMKALIDISPSEYLRQYRLKKALHLLKQKDVSVAETAFNVGFKDPAHFSRVFTAHFGYPPSKIIK